MKESFKYFVGPAIEVEVPLVIGGHQKLLYKFHTFRIHSNVTINWEAEFLPGGQRDRTLRIFII